MQSCQSAQNESILERHIKFNRKSAGTRCLPVFGDEIANSGSSCKHFFFSSIFLSLMGKRLFGSMTAELHNPFRKNFKRSPVYYLLNYVPPKGSGGGVVVHLHCAHGHGTDDAVALHDHAESDFQKGRKRPLRFFSC